MNLSVEERKRRASVIRIDSKGAFWELIKEELKSISEFKKKNALKLIAKGMNIEALAESNQAIGIDLAIDAPEEIIKAHDNIFNRAINKVSDLVR